MIFLNYGGKMGNSLEIREQVQEYLLGYKTLGEKSRPHRGWVRSIREALGMSSRQLAERLGVKPPRITEMEKAEVQGRVSLKSLQKAAEAMDCVLVYALIPRTDMGASLRKQAEKVAADTMKNISHTMQLEDQGLTKKEESKQIEAKVDEWVRNPPRWLWDLK